MIQERFFQDLMEWIDELGSDVTTGVIYTRWYNKYGHSLSPFDNEIVNGEPRWKNNLRWAVKKLKEDHGLLVPTEQQKKRGQWQTVPKFPGFWDKVREVDKKYERRDKW